MGRPKASDRVKAVALAFVRLVTKPIAGSGVECISINTQFGRKSLHSGLVFCLPQLTRCGDVFENREGISEMEMNKLLRGQGHNMVRKRDSLLPGEACRREWADLRWMDPAASGRDSDCALIANGLACLQRVFPEMRKCSMDSILAFLMAARQPIHRNYKTGAVDDMHGMISSPILLPALGVASFLSIESRASDPSNRTISRNSPDVHAFKDVTSRTHLLSATTTGHIDSSKGRFLELNEMPHGVHRALPSPQQCENDRHHVAQDDLHSRMAAAMLGSDVVTAGNSNAAPDEAAAALQALYMQRLGQAYQQFGHPSVNQLMPGLLEELLRSQMLTAVAAASGSQQPNHAFPQPPPLASLPSLLGSCGGGVFSDGSLPAVRLPNLNVGLAPWAAPTVPAFGGGVGRRPPATSLESESDSDLAASLRYQSLELPGLHLQ